MLLTDRRRSQGRIIANTRRGRQAARFTIAHEIGHFLLERHRLGEGGVFQCQISDLREVATSKQPKRQEVEANTFAIGLLAPHYLVSPFVAEDPEIDVIERMRTRLDLSREAAARCLIELHDHPLAVVWAKDGVIRYVIRNERFPWVKWSRRDRLPPLSLTHRQARAGVPGMSDLREVAPGAWTDGEVDELFEQVLVAKAGHSMTLLVASLAPAIDDD